MWELDHKEGWVLKDWCFQTVVWEKTLESPLDRKEIKPFMNPEYSLEGLMLNLRVQYLVTWGKKPTHWKRPWCWERLMAGREGDVREWDGWMASLILMSLSKLRKIVKNREAWHAAVHGVTKSWIWLSDWTTTMLIFEIMKKIYLHFRNFEYWQRCKEMKDLA